MTFNEALNLIEESSPEKIAFLLDKKCKNFYNDGTQIESVINLIYNEIKLSNGLIPIGNNNFINSKDKEQMYKYVSNIKKLLKTKDEKALSSIDSAFTNFLNKLF